VFIPVFLAIAVIPIEAGDLLEINHVCILLQYTNLFKCVQVTPLMTETNPKQELRQRCRALRRGQTDRWIAKPLSKLGVDRGFVYFSICCTKSPVAMALSPSRR
jgi:hypothetical protein